MMGLIADAAMQLTEDSIRRFDTPDGVKVTVAPSLCDLLDNAVVSSIGGTMKGSTLAFEKCVIDEDAMRLRDEIRQTCLSAVIINHRTVKYGSTGQIVAQWARMLDDIHTSTKKRYTGYEERQVSTWADRIWEIIDAPHVAEIRGTCPRCGERRHKGTYALSAKYRDGEEPYAECAACGVVWQGELQLRRLGEQVKTPMVAA